MAPYELDYHFRTYTKTRILEFHAAITGKFELDYIQLCNNKDI